MANQFDSVWPEERIERLRELWDEGHSSAEIGRLMGTTKNAIVGKAHRIDLPSRPSPIHSLAPGQSYKKQKPRPRVLKTLPDLPSIAAMPAPPPPSRPAVIIRKIIPLAVVRPVSAPRHIEPRLPSVVPFNPIKTCQTITNSGRFGVGITFCDKPTIATKPYCKPCADRYFVRLRDRREDAA